MGIPLHFFDYIRLPLCITDWPHHPPFKSSFSFIIPLLTRIIYFTHNYMAVPDLYVHSPTLTDVLHSNRHVHVCMFDFKQDQKRSIEYWHMKL